MSTDVTFEESALEPILAAFDKDIDDEGYIVEAETHERVLTPEGEEILAEELGGIAEGSEMFIEDNFVSVIEYVKSRDG